VNISTSSQICITVNKSKLKLIRNFLPKSVSIFPYFDDRVMLVSASLNGGNVLEAFVKILIDSSLELFGIVDEKSEKNMQQEAKEGIWKKLIELAQQESCNLDENQEIKCKPTLFGERHDKETFASLSNISIKNFSIGNMFLSICRGLVKNLKEMITSELLNELNCERIIATGGAIARNSILKDCLEKEFSCFKIIYKEKNDAALGAAYFIQDKLKNEKE
jgi:sedoheptulokinase